MSIIRQVDMQVMLHRAPEINRLTNNDGSRAEGQNNQFAQSFQKAVEQEGKQVANSNQAEKANVDKDGKGGKGGGKSRKDTRPRKGKEDKKEEAGKGMLDVRI